MLRNRGAPGALFAPFARAWVVMLRKVSRPTALRAQFL